MSTPRDENSATSTCLVQCLYSLVLGMFVVKCFAAIGDTKIVNLLMKSVLQKLLQSTNSDKEQVQYRSITKGEAHIVYFKNQKKIL